MCQFMQMQRGDSFTCATIIRITVWTAIIFNITKIHWSYDGKYSADIWGVNGSSPGPTVKVKMAMILSLFIVIAYLKPFR